MTYLARFDARTRRRLAALRLRHERGLVDEFDVWTREGAWYCPVPPPWLPRPNTTPETGRRGAAR